MKRLLSAVWQRIQKRLFGRATNLTTEEPWRDVSITVATFRIKK